MSKEDKEDFKSARVPVIRNSSKRKISDSNPPDNVSSKLARFAASKE
jgi:hypothetical protein